MLLPRHNECLTVNFFSPKQDVCIEIAKQLEIAPVALDFFTLMTTDCEHCLRPNRQIKQQCDKQNDHYLNPKRVLHEDELASKVFFFRLAFKAVAGPDLKVVNCRAYEYFVMQVRVVYVVQIKYLVLCLYNSLLMKIILFDL
jgi:hypothetical protein